MSADLGAFEAFYAGPVQHPLLLWLAAAAGVALCLTKRGLSPSLRRFCLCLGLLSVLDAWLTSNVIFGLGSLPSSLAAAIPLFFVLAGDFRYLLLVTAGTEKGGLELNTRRLLAAAGLTAIVPIFTQGALSLLPDEMSGPRTMFLIYEVSFAILTMSLMRWHPHAHAIPWIRNVSRFVILYYGLWATADVVILSTGSDLGYLLRALPNLLYYGGLIAVVGWLAPEHPTPNQSSAPVATV